MKSVRKRLTYANVMSSIAVFLVVAGGTAFAAVELGKESVGTKQLAKEAVSLAKIKKAAKNALKGATGPAGQKGANGATGAKGDKGDKGDRGEKGERGPSAGFSIESDDFVEFTGGPEQVVSSLNLPAGNFVVTAWANGNNNSAAIAGTICHLFLGTTEIAETNLVRFGKDAEADRQMITMSAGGSLSGPSTAQLRCTETTSNGNFLGHGITAVQVGSLN